MNAALLETENLRLQAGARNLVRDLAWHVHAGERWALLGPNGSGKTTMLHTLAGLRTCITGRIAWRGRAVADWPLDEAARFRGLLPQHIHDALAARAIDVVLLGRHPHRLASSGRFWEDADDHAIAEAAMQAVDAADLAARDVTTLSGGERQRVAIAALLAQAPTLRLLDEPTAHLDLRHQLRVLQHLRETTDASCATILALHDLDHAARWATHVLLLDGHGGAIHGPANEVMTDDTLSRVFGVRVRRAQLDGLSHFVIA